MGSLTPRRFSPKYGRVVWPSEIEEKNKKIKEKSDCFLNRIKIPSLYQKSEIGNRVITRTTRTIGETFAGRNYIMATEFCKKMSTKVVWGGQPNKAQFSVNEMKADGKTPTGKIITLAILELYTLIGICTNVKTVATGFGEADKFIGDFEATNSATGEVFQSNVYYGPAVLAGALRMQLTQADQKGVKFAVKIGIKPNLKAKDGYEYTMAPIVPFKENDAMAELRAKALELTSKK